MCGIYGFNWSDKKLLHKMDSVLKHRGPDGYGSYIDKTISLGHRRLAIIDLSITGKQPMSYEKNGRKVVIIFNGEIYNYKELREILEKKGYSFKSDSDTEVILASYIEYGSDCVNYLNGMWAFCLYDCDKKIIFLSRDRLGVKPLYYYADKKEGKLIFASEIKAILKFDEIKRRINKIALNNFISLRYIPGDNTVFDGIKRIPPTHNLVFNLLSNKIELFEYWDLTKKTLNMNEDDAAKKLFELLKKSVKYRLISDVPLGLFLSGGLDSSAVLSAMSEIKKEEGSKEEIKTFSVGFEHGEYVNELPYAKEMSELFNTKHKEIKVKSNSASLLSKIIWHLDEPMADPALIPLYILSENARKDVTVVLTGDGGDELFAGYDQYKFLEMGRKLSKFPLANHSSKIMRILPYGILNKMYKYSSKMGTENFSKVDNMISEFKHKNETKAYDEFVSLINEEERSKLLNGNWFEKKDYRKLNKKYFDTKESYLNQLLYYDIKNVLPENFLMKTDRMTMANSLEGREPLLDYKFAEFSYSLNPNLKLRNGTSKYIFKRALHNYLPKDIIYRKKQSFHVPIERWVKKDLKEEFDSALNEKEIKKMNIFEYDEIKKIFQNFDKGELFYARKTWNLLCFKIWHDTFMGD